MRTMSVGRISRCGVLVAGLALGLSTGPTVRASSVTAVNGTYQESTNATSTAPPTGTACNSSLYCYLVFARVPIGKQLIVTQVSCQVNVSAGAITQILLEPQTPNGAWMERFQFLPSTERPSTTPGVNVIVNSTVLQVFKEKERPEVFFQTDSAANYTGFCSVSGQLIDAP